MKILSVIDAISGGGAMVMYNIIKELPHHDHMIATAIAHETRAIGLPQMIGEAGIIVKCLNTVETNAVNTLLKDFILEYNPDIILNHWWKSSRFQSLNNFGSKARLILLSHNNDPSPPGYDMYISVSQYNSQFQKHIKNDKANHKVIYNGIDLSRFNVPKQTTPGRFTIGRISALPKFKIIQNYISFIDAFDISNVLYKVVGEGRQRKQLMRDVQRLGIQNKFEFTGEIPNEQVPNMLATFDMVLYLTEKSEAFSLSILEAMAAGLPIVAQNKGGIPEQIIHGKTGFLCQSQEEIKHYCETLARDRQLLQQMGQAAKERAKLFCVKAMAKEYEKLFYQMI